LSLVQVGIAKVIQVMHGTDEAIDLAALGQRRQSASTNAIMRVVDVESVALSMLKILDVFRDALADQHLKRCGRGNGRHRSEPAAERSAKTVPARIGRVHDGLMAAIG